jgi:DNA replication protein DnaC
MSAELHRELHKEIQLNKSTGTQVKSIVTKMCECEVLLLDDVGNEYMSEYVHEALSVVINTRYFEHNKDNPRPMRTIITSNYNPRELHNLWSEKIGKGKSLQLISRLKHFGVIEMKGRNWRK